MVSWAGRLTPDTNSRSQCQFGVLAVGGGLCECRYGGARWFLRGPAGQWRLHFEARGQGIDGTLRHPFHGTVVPLTYRVGIPIDTGLG